MDPRDVRLELVYAIEDEMLYIASDYPIGEIGDVYKRLSEYFQALGICYILEFANVDKFQENLVLSGYARRFYLKKSYDYSNTTDRYLAISRSEAFLDSLAAGNLRLAREISSLSLIDWNPNWEYEDDFCFFQILYGLLREQNGLSENQTWKIIDRFEAALEGGQAVRLEVCKALIAKDSDRFILAMQELMDEKIQDNHIKREKMLEPNPSTCIFWPRSFISIEGLALLKIAEIIGMPIVEDFPLCPNIARLPTEEKLYSDFFEEIEACKIRGY